MEEEEQPRALFEGGISQIPGVSSRTCHETSKFEFSPQLQEEEEGMFAASDSFCNTMCAMISKPDVEKIGQIQLEALTRFQEMNVRFNEFNRYSFDRYERLNPHFHNHTRMIVDMKKDLDIIFRRIRNLKAKLTKQYGEAFAVTSASIQKLEKEIEADQEDYKQEEKPQTVQQGLLSSGHPKNTSYDASRIDNTVDQPQDAFISGTTNASGSQSSDIRKEIQTFEKPLDQGEIQMPVLRPQLSSSDDDYSSEENKIQQEQSTEEPLNHKKAQMPVLRPQLSSSDDNYSAEKTDDNKKENQSTEKPLNQEGKVQKAMPVLRPQLSSSDDNYSAEETGEDTQGIQNNYSDPAINEASDSENKSSKANYSKPLRPEISSSDESLEDDTEDSEEESETNAGIIVSTSPLNEEVPT